MRLFILFYILIITFYSCRAQTLGKTDKNLINKPDTINVSGVFWKFKQAEFDKISYSTLDSLTLIIQEKVNIDSIRIEVVGTYLIEESAHYSQKRAESIKQYFIEKGIKKRKILAVGKVILVETPEEHKTTTITLYIY